ncbi:unnamed protein product (macronuclear) [Paramecium tetraurelia]|uniref:Uncharacterized protein n=1 Tax=Paramecium tetraurelia TaxID=5888 RepID=A0CJJ2_PARTE|nr:uncharacterized protein GSPATT00000670001 [Paramecium tetraurelia]CAK70959.1 unnamed protein product [Paramecium tetraurelia]|eukprot:XP_001438356.1 hypothetical protein (macronuclear) [Paramecium tetraurelia strain d4-2]
MYSPNYPHGEFNGQIGAIPQQPGQLIQNAKFTAKKDYATWAQEVPPLRPKSREMELMDLLLVNNIAKKQTSLPYINQNRSPKPENVQTSRLLVPMHPQYHHLSPYPIPPGYPLPNMNQVQQFQYFPAPYAQNQIAHMPQQQIIHSNRNSESTLEYMKEMIKKQNEFQARQEKLEKQLIKLRKKPYKLNEQTEMSFKQPKLFDIPPPIYPFEQPRIITNRQSDNKKVKKLNYQINMLKELQQIKNISNGVLESESQSSESSVEYVQKPRKQRLKPVPIPPYYDLTQDEQRLKNLIKQNSNYKIKRIFIMVTYLMFQKKQFMKVGPIKNQISKDKTPQLENEYKTELMRFSPTVSDPLVQKMAQMKVNLRVVATPEQKVTPKALIQNSNALKQYISDVFQAVSNYSLKKNSLEYLSKITRDFEFLQQNYHSKFELNRLQFGYSGCLKNMQPATQNLMIIINFWIRFFIPLSFPETQKNIKDINEVMQTNLKTIVSALYQIALQACKNLAQPIPNNTKEIPTENITKEKNPFLIRLDQFRETQEEMNLMTRMQTDKLDEPLLYPVYTLREMDKFFDNERSFITEKIQYLINWCSGVMESVNNFKQQERQEMRKQKKQQLDILNQNVIEPKKNKVAQIIKDQKTLYQQNSSEIKQLKQKIQEEKEKNEKMKKDYDEAVKKHEEKQEKLILLGVK